MSYLVFAAWVVTLIGSQIAIQSQRQDIQYWKDMAEHHEYRRLENAKERDVLLRQLVILRGEES